MPGVRAFTILNAGLLIGLTGCGNDTQPGEEQGASSRVRDERETLQNLGYVGEVEGDESGLDVYDEERSYPGYTLISLHMKAMARLIDQNGEVIKDWSDPGGRHWDNVELLPGGDLITTGADPANVPNGIKDEARYAMRLSWDGKVIWKKYLRAHHDITLSPRGELLTLTFSRRDEPSVHKTVDLRADEITRLSQDGDVLGVISVYDAARARPELYPLRGKKPAPFGGRVWVDLLHLNSVEQMHHEHLFDKHPIYAPSNVLVCSRHQDLIAIINIDTQALIWSWGRDDLGDFPAAALPLDGPHDATALANGNIMVFDNGLTRGWSRIVELDPIEGKIVWQWYDERDKRQAEKYKGNLARRTDSANRTFYTKSKGSNQRLPNGNTLICNSDNGEIFEITPEGEVVWRYLSTERAIKKGRELRAAFVRAYRYEREFIDDLIDKHKKAREATDAAD